jgi:REP element-mobilizing transposase RayT/AraC-like DNA-binding protein
MCTLIARYIGRMTRPLRLEFAGALYHVTSRGDRKNFIFRDDSDRLAWLTILAKVCKRSNFIVHAFCQMTNHYHVVIETVDGNLARGMRQLNGAYSQYFNRRHDLVGHVLQGRYKAILVQKESYLLELARYVVLNPIRAGMVASLADWQWSSHPYVMRTEGKPSWLETDWLLSHFGADRASARQAYHAFVLNGRGLLSPLRDVQHQMLLGDSAFVARFILGAPPDKLDDIVKTQRRAVAIPLEEYAAEYGRSDEAVARAYASMAYTMQDIADHFRISISTVSRILKRVEL